jgi:HK97 family phage major capsid protein
MPFNNVTSRTDAAAEVPEDIAGVIVGAIETESLALRMGRRLTMSARDSRVRVLSAVPTAYWVGGDTGLKQTSEAGFVHQQLTAEEMAVILPVPDAVVADADYDLWAELRPLVARAFAQRLDRAVLFGVGSPASWGPGLVQRATTAGNTIAGTDDGPVDLLNAAELLATKRVAPTAAVVRPGWQYAAAVRRTDAFTANPVGATTAFPLSLAGLGIVTDPLIWDPAVADAIVADWSQIMIGVRQDLRFEIFNTGVITDDTGAILYNLLQQDMSAMRVTMRVAFDVVTPTNADGARPAPVAVVTPAA